MLKKNLFRAIITALLLTGLLISCDMGTTALYNIGDEGPAGGIIFYDKGDNMGGWRYLEAAPVDISGTKTWGATSIDVPGTLEVIGFGGINTGKILNAAPTAPAAKACKDYTNKARSDWFLPSVDELRRMRLNLKDTEHWTGFSSSAYWSSQQNNITDAFAVYFSDGTIHTHTKTTAYRVRPIRAF